MANPGGLGTKFVSVNLNKSYGPESNRNNSINNNNSSTTYGQAASSRGRGGSAGGGMVVLSRPRSSSQKLSGPKLSVPPPLNLPSLRKEHERFDISGTGGGGSAAAGAARPASSGVGWTKPASVSIQDVKNEKFDQGVGNNDGLIKNGSAYMPPSARFVPPSLPPDRAAVLRGEDFPSLKAALPSGTASGPAQRQKDAANNKKQKQILTEESVNEKTERKSLSPEVYPIHNQNIGKGSNKKDDFFPGPLPLVRLNPRSDWADDERDTGHGLVDKSKDYGNSNNYSNNEAYWDRDFDVPRNRGLPHKPSDNQFQKWGKREDENVKTFIMEAPKIDSFVKAPSRDGNSWRSSSLTRDTENDKYVPTRVGEYSRGNATVNQENNFGKRDGFGQAHQRYHTGVNDRKTQDFYGNEQSSRYKGYNIQNNSIPKSSFSPSGKGFSTNDSILNVGREKNVFSNGERPSTGDAFNEDDSFSSALVGVIKRKKDIKQAEFHDPVRESFEAELERVQKMQEQERQRVLEEQERVLEKARREEEERERLIREEQDQKRRVEEAAREEAWRIEQERIESIRRAEELKIAREKEKQNLIMEEERRKQAAKQKLLELEAKIAKRKAETVQDSNIGATSDNKGINLAVEKDFESWEDSERMVERITTSGSSDSSGPNRSFDPGHRSQWRSGGAFLKKDFHEGPGYMPSRDYYNSENQENYTRDYPYNRSMDTESDFHENVPEKYGDSGWGQGRFRGNTHNYSNQERLNSDGDELYPYGRSRYSMRQPRVLPPPSLVPIQKTVSRGENEKNLQENSGETSDISQKNNVAEKLMEKDSHSSLSVSSPPDSSTHFSHDDLDESGDSLNTEGKIIVEDIIAEKNNVAAISDADEDWSVENNEELQEQEEYDEEEGGYQVLEDEVHEGDDNDKSDLNQEFNDLNINEKDSLDIMENIVLGFDEGVEVGLPSGYGESSSRNEEDEIPTQEADIEITDSNIPPINTDIHTVPVSNYLNNVNGSSVNIASHSSAGHCIPSVPVAYNPVDFPIKLQFGLFTGPPLTASPVSAIQIGSIQMPLHIHPSLTQINQSQGPLFQFGKLRTITPISQMSYIQPSIQTHYNMNQSSVGQLPIQPKLEGLGDNIIKDGSSSSVGGASNVAMEKVPEVTNANKNKFMAEVKEKEKPFSGQENYRQFAKGMYHSDDSRGFRAQGQQSGFKSKRYAYVARNSNLRSDFPDFEASRINSGGFQRRPRRTVHRTEFRVRENIRQNVGIYVRNGSRKGSIANKSEERMVELESSSLGQQTNTDFRVNNKNDKELLSEVEKNPQQVNLKGNIVLDEDVDAPLQSGIVHIYKQPGIEAPSDEDDFIQVRSKRQMLNDRREQREKEIKAKSRIMKAPRRVGPTAPSAIISRSSYTKPAILGGELPKNTRSDVMRDGKNLTKIETSKPLAPIGTPAVTSDLQADKRPHNMKSPQTSAISAIPDSGNDLGSSLVFETQNKIPDDQTSLGSWGTSHINQQVMALTQTQLDEAMRPGRFDAHVNSTSGHNSSVVNPIMPPSSVLTKEKSYSSTASPVNSLLAGEKIQFGAVTSPTILPSTGRAVSHGTRAPGSSRADIQISHSLSNSESDSNNLQFEKENNQNESCDHLEDAEDEAEAAASAVAVAAIGSDDSVSVMDAKAFRGADATGVTGGVAGDQRQSRAEESLSVALPADLSVETMPMSLWPSLPSPQSVSGQMLSHFPGGPTSPFPFYDMGPMMRGPIFAFGPQDESGGDQSQPQKNGVGPWQDSFYGHPTGFPGPYIGPHGGIQGPHPHMVVYNQFPVGQFGQVGLSFMGTTYIPSGKQPDWKHNMNNREGDLNNNMNMGSGQQHNNNNNAPGMAASPVQHMAPPSQLLSMPSPLSLFDASRFQPAPEQGRWPHVTSSPLQSAPLSLPMQQQETGGVLSFSQIRSEPRISTNSDTTQNSTHFPDESIQSSTIAHTAKSDGAQIGGNNNNNNNNTPHNMHTYKNRAPQQKNFPGQHQYNHHSIGYGYQRNRMGYNQGRNNSMGSDRNFPTKIKQIYVAKQSTTGGSNVG